MRRLARPISKGNCRSNNFAHSELDLVREHLDSAACLHFRQHRKLTKRERVRRMATSIILPQQVPVMPLAGALLFPHALLPLYIFEPRYRQMLKHALGHHRMFCVALLKPHCAAWQSPADFFQTAGVGLIRACIERGDGTSNLILQGLERVRFTDFEQKAPFPIATIEGLESASDSSVETDALARKVLELYSNLKADGPRQLPP